MKKKSTSTESGKKLSYPRMEKLGIRITYPEAFGGMGCVSRFELVEGLRRNGLSVEKFGEFFGVQTCPSGGVYAHDAEAVLERMISGKFTGTQLFWD